MPSEWIRPQRLDYLPLDERLAVVRLVAQLGGAPPRRPALVLGAPEGILRAPALGSVTHHVPRRRAADELLWRVTFAVPLEQVRCPRALFGLVAAGHLPTRLPDPWLATRAALSEPWPLGDRYVPFTGAALWRRAAALGTAATVAGSGLASPVAALASGQSPAHHARAVVLAPRQLPSHTQTPPSSAPTPPHSTSTPSAPPGSSPAPAASAGHARSGSGYAPKPDHRAAPASRRRNEGASTKAAARSGPSSANGSVPTHPANASHKGASAPAPAQSAAHGAPERHRSKGSHHRPLDPSSGASGLSTISLTPPAGLATGEGAYHHAATKAHRHERHRHAGATRPRRHHPSGGAPVTNPPPPPPPSVPDEPETPTSSSSVFNPSSAFPSGNNPWTSHMPGLFATGYRPPAWLIPIYKKAGAKYHVPWQILAAINSIETNYGRDLNVSPAGAVGWMQFMPATWLQYGVAVDHSGPPNPNNPADAIFSAARYLAANGAPKHLRRAVFAYNHAVWYVNEVLWRASVINALAHGHAAPGFANPFPGGWVPNRLDMGYDGTFGRVLVAPFSGTITFAARSFSNWGGYVEIRADHRIKMLPTSTFYFAEGLSPLFPAGTHVTAGTPIAKPAPSPWGDAYNTTGQGQGQIEWGPAGSGPTGVPTNPLAETGMVDPARMVKTFAIWLVEHLGVAPPASTDHAGYA